MVGKIIFRSRIILQDYEDEDMNSEDSSAEMEMNTYDDSVRFIQVHLDHTGAVCITKQTEAQRSDRFQHQGQNTL